MTTTKIKLIMNRSNKLELFLHAELKVSSPINVCRAVGGIPAAETNHFSLSCHPRGSFIIYAKQLSTVVKFQMVVSQFCFFFCKYFDSSMLSVGELQHTGDLRD